MQFIRFSFVFDFIPGEFVLMFFRASSIKNTQAEYKQQHSQLDIRESCTTFDQSENEQAIQINNV